MSSDLQGLAGAAQAQVDGPVDWNVLVETGTRNLVRMRQFIEAMRGKADVWEDYAEALGKGELTEAEKKQAILDAVLEQTE